MMWIAGTPSNGMCDHKHTLPSLPDVLRIPFVVTHITPFHKGNLVIISLVGYIPLKYYTYSLQNFRVHITVGKYFKSTCFYAPALVIKHCYTLIITELTDVLSARDFHKYKFPVCTF